MGVLYRIVGEQSMFVLLVSLQVFLLSNTFRAAVNVTLIALLLVLGLLVLAERFWMSIVRRAAVTCIRLAKVSNHVVSEFDLATDSESGSTEILGEQGEVFRLPKLSLLGKTSPAVLCLASVD